MKGLAFVSLLFSAQLFAVDTSGCSQMVTKTALLETSKHALISVSSTKAPRPDCWNVSDSRIKVLYQWRQDGFNSKYTDIGFWIRVNSESDFINVAPQSIRCSVDGLFYGKSGEGQSICSAVAYKTIGNIKDWDIEIAPQLNLDWDTYGYDNNYNFSL